MKINTKRIVLFIITADVDWTFAKDTKSNRMRKEKGCVCGVIVIIVENGHDKSSSNPGCLYFT